MLYTLTIALLGIFAALGFAAVSALIDVEHITKQQYIESHVSRWIMRLYFFLAMGTQCACWSLGSALIFTAVFDQFMNYGMNKPFFYLGTVAKWDIFFQRTWFYFKLPRLIGKEIWWSVHFVHVNFRIFYIAIKVIAFITGMYLFTLTDLSFTDLIEKVYFYHKILQGN